jgi:hypothetical protein
MQPKLCLLGNNDNLLFKILQGALTKRKSLKTVFWRENNIFSGFFIF